MNIYLSSLSFKCRKEDLEKLFEPYASVTNARIITDKASHRSLGYGFVDIEDEEAGRAAIEALNGIEHMGRRLIVQEAKPRETEKI